MRGWVDHAGSRGAGNRPRALRARPAATERQVLRARWLELYRTVALGEIDAVARTGADDTAFRRLREGHAGGRLETMARLIAGYRRQVLRLSELAARVAAGDRSAAAAATRLGTELERARQEILHAGYSGPKVPVDTPLDADVAVRG